MSNKHEILEMLKKQDLTIKDIADNSKFNENEVRTYVHRLLNEGLIEKIGNKKRYHQYAAKKKEQFQNNDLLERLVLLMVKAGINSEKYEINIKESEIQPIINNLMESGKLG